MKGVLDKSLDINQCILFYAYILLHIEYSDSSPFVQDLEIVPCFKTLLVHTQSKLLFRFLTIKTKTLL